MPPAAWTNARSDPHLSSTLGDAAPRPISQLMQPRFHSMVARRQRRPPRRRPTESGSVVDCPVWLMAEIRASFATVARTRLPRVTWWRRIGREEIGPAVHVRAWGLHMDAASLRRQMGAEP